MSDHLHDAPIPILYRDECLLAVNKPSGLLVHRSAESSDRVFLLQIVRAQTGAFLYPVHRLDRATSGVVVFALSSDDARELQERMRAPDAVKEYLALVKGEAPLSGVIDRPLTNDAGVPQAALTRFERLACWDGVSLLRVRISTGRRHQIRRHLSHITHQIIGDSTYGKGGINRRFRGEFGLPRLFLHSTLTSFSHPRRNEKIELHAPLPDDLRKVLKRLPGAQEELLNRL